MIRLATITALLLAAPLAVSAHTFHQSRTGINHNTKAGALEIILQIHIDDLEAPATPLPTSLRNEIMTALPDQRNLVNLRTNNHPPGRPASPLPTFVSSVSSVSTLPTSRISRSGPG